MKLASDTKPCSQAAGDILLGDDAATALHLNSKEEARGKQHQVRTWGFTLRGGSSMSKTCGSMT